MEGADKPWILVQINLGDKDKQDEQDGKEEETLPQASNINYNLTPHLYSLHGTQQRQRPNLRPRRVLPTTSNTNKRAAVMIS